MLWRCSPSYATTKAATPALRIGGDRRLHDEFDEPRGPPLRLLELDVGPEDLFPAKNITDETLSYDIDTDTWTTLAPLVSPPPLVYGTMQGFPANGIKGLHMFLGYDLRNDGPEGEADVQSFNDEVWRFSACRNWS